MDRIFLHDTHESNEYLSVECAYTKLEYAELHDAIAFETGNKGDNEDSALGYSGASPYEIFTSTIVSVDEARKFALAILGLCDRIEKAQELKRHDEDSKLKDVS
jgi:hypothetical protein